MKKIVSMAILIAAVAILGTALTGADTDEATSPLETSAKSTKPCCQGSTADADSVCADEPKSGCCLNGQTKSTANAASCGEECSAVTAASAVQTGAQKCANCSEDDCTEECSSCAEARQAAAVAESDLSASGGEHRGMGQGNGMGHGHAGDPQHEKDHKDFFFLIDHRDSIRRTVKNLPNGVETLTESDAVDVADMIQVHVEAMYDRMENMNPIRMRDPLFREVFANADKIEMDVEHTEHGVRVKETSKDEYVVRLLQEHAKVVSLWIKNGYSELPKNHAPPKR